MKETNVVPAILTVGFYSKKDFERGLRPASPLACILCGLILLAMGAFFLAPFWMGLRNTHLTRQESLWLLTLGSGGVGTGLMLVGVGVRRFVLVRRGLGMPAAPPRGAYFRILQVSLPVMGLLSYLVTSGHHGWLVISATVVLTLILACGLVWTLIRER